MSRPLAAEWWRRTLITGKKIKIFSQASFTGVNVLEPAVEDLMWIVKVILTCAARGMACSGSFCICQAWGPAVVSAKCQEQVATIILEGLCKEVGSSTDVEIGLPAVTTRGTSTLVSRNLHKALFTSASDFILIARAFLHGDGGKDD